MENHKVSIQDIERLADMSGLIFSDEEKDKMLNEVNGVIEMLNLCEKVETDKKPNHIILGLEDLRPDEIEMKEPIDMIINCPSKRKGCYVVPKVVE